MELTLINCSTLKYKNIEKELYNTKTYPNVKRMINTYKRLKESHLISGLSPKAAKNKSFYFQNVYNIKSVIKTNRSSAEHVKVTETYLW